MVRDIYYIKAVGRTTRTQVTALFETSDVLLSRTVYGTSIADLVSFIFHLDYIVPFHSSFLDESFRRAFVDEHSGVGIWCCFTCANRYLLHALCSQEAICKQPPSSLSSSSDQHPGAVDFCVTQPAYCSRGLLDRSLRQVLVTVDGDKYLFKELCAYVGDYVSRRRGDGGEWH